MCGALTYFFSKQLVDLPLLTLLSATLDGHRLLDGRGFQAVWYRFGDFLLTTRLVAVCSNSVAAAIAAVWDSGT